MKRDGIYGEYFPPSLSTFGYNEACVHEQFPMTKEEALKQGFKWEDHPRGTYGKETIGWDKVSDSIHDIQCDATKEIFACTACKKNYRIIPDEFSFYKSLNIPLPRLCPNCRHIRRFAARGPNKLLDRNCRCGGQSSITNDYRNTSKHFHGENPCPNEFQSVYDSEKGTLYCETCYNAEVA